MTQKRRNKDLELAKIQKSLKALMKVKKETYDTLGEALSISPATIKRRLNGDQLTTTDLTELANALGVSFYELIERSKSEGSQIYEFTEDQEKILSSDLNFIHVFRMALMGKSLEHIGKRLAVSEGRLRDILRKLESVGLLQLRVRDRIVPIAKFPFKWRPGGQLDRVYNRFLVVCQISFFKIDDAPIV